VTIDLRAGDQQAHVLTRGGRVVRYAVDGREVLGHRMSARPDAFHGALLAPWPNRVPSGRWTREGQELQLPVNEPATGAALHGLVHDADFVVREMTPERVHLTHDLAPSTGYPFSLQVHAEYVLSESGLACALTAVNTGRHPAPVGLGAHPYVDAPAGVDRLTLTVPAQTVAELDWQGRPLPAQPVADGPRDFRRPRVVGADALDTAFTDLAVTPDEPVRVVVSAPEEPDVVLTLGPSCRWLMVFTADVGDPALARRGLALEPMSCAPGDLGGADVLPYGESLTLAWSWSVG
jgi:aldose 1-epimerase